MEKLSIYFEPLNIEQGLIDESPDAKPLKSHTVFNTGVFPDLRDAEIVVFGVEEGRGNPEHSLEYGVNKIRDQFYRLFPKEWPDLRLVDLGNIKPGLEKNDTYHAVTEVVSELVKIGKLPIILGGEQDIAYASYLAYEKLEQTVNLVSIDAKLDIGDSEGDINCFNYISKILMHQPNYLFNYSNLGHQTYLTNPKYIELMRELFFDCLRVGEIQADISLAEPVLRNADLLSVDLGVLRSSEFSSSFDVGPNGLYGPELCQLMFYAGMSDKLTSIGIFGYISSYDQRNIDAKLIAQALWCFLDGYYNRREDYPVGDKKDYTRFQVVLTDIDHEVAFYKSPRSGRWWLEVPYPANKRVMFERHHLVPCSYDVYEQATRNEVPDLWWRTYQKLS